MQLSGQLCQLYLFSSFQTFLTFSDDPDSYCFGSIRDGVFDGQIITKGGTYYVERSHKHFQKDALQKLRGGDGHTGNPQAHSVIYHEKHIQYPVTHHRNSKLGSIITKCSLQICDTDDHYVFQLHLHLVVECPMIRKSGWKQFKIVHIQTLRRTLDAKALIELSILLLLKPHIMKFSICILPTNTRKKPMQRG